jgi:hypothetical protein
MSVVYRHAGRAGHFLATGTYRSSDGRPVHCRLSAGGALAVEVEDTDAVRIVPRLDALVRLSDYPDWPDLDQRGWDTSLFD